MVHIVPGDFTFFMYTCNLWNDNARIIHGIYSIVSLHKCIFLYSSQGNYSYTDTHTHIV